MEYINDSYLGIIKYSDEYDWYEGKINLETGEAIEFFLNVEDDFSEVLKYTQKIISNLSQQSANYKNFIADKLLDLYNDTWSEDEVIDKPEFCRRIAIESVQVYDDGSVEIFYEDGDLFAGHTILIYINSNGELVDVDIAG